MGIDWIVDLPCEPKRVLGSSRLVGLVKGRLRAEMLLVERRARGFVERPAELLVRETARRFEGEESRERTLAELLAEGAVLDDLEVSCIGCSANLGATAFGCRGEIAYPIEAKTELWLASLLPADELSTAALVLAAASAELRESAARAAEMRGSGRVFFELAEAPRPSIDARADGDLLFALLFGASTINRARAAAIAVVFGLLPESISLDEFGAIAADPSAFAAALERSPRAVPDADDQVGGVACFLRAVAAAAAHGVTTSIDA